MNIQMVDLKGQYHKIKIEIDQAIQDVLDSAKFIGGDIVDTFKRNLQNYLGIQHVVPCANGTDALQIALMALDLNPGDEIIVPAFTYVATAEVIALLKLKPIMVDVDRDTFNTTAELIEPYISEKTKVIIPVHLFGQSSEMEGIIDLANHHNIKIIEDNAQAIGAEYGMQKAGTIGDIGTTSFFPSKNLGCYGDGGAIFTNNETLAKKIKMIANHGQNKKYYHDIIGCNSRLDAIQAAVLNVKLKYLDNYCSDRQKVAQTYNIGLAEMNEIITPKTIENASHVYHQYTLKVKNNRRDALKSYLTERNIPSMIYYPLPLYRQRAFSKYVGDQFDLDNTEGLCREVLSLPIHTEMKDEEQSYIVQSVKEFFN